MVLAVGCRMPWVSGRVWTEADGAEVLQRALQRGAAEPEPRLCSGALTLSVTLACEAEDLCSCSEGLPST